MKKICVKSLPMLFIRPFLLLAILMSAMGCAGFVEKTTPPKGNSLLPLATPTDETQWSIYHSDPQHLWNRIFRQFFRRTTKDGKEYGWDSLDPLLWPETTHLLEGARYDQTIQLLDEFLTTDGEELITNPLKRAMFQRDLWAVFDWLTLQSDDYTEERHALQERIVRMMKRLALTEQEILSLPDTYSAALDSGAFPSEFQAENPTTPFLPSGMLSPSSAWVCVGRKGGPIAMTHTQEFPFFGRSVFLVFMRVPEGRDATSSFIQELNAEPSPHLPAGLEVALIRRTILLDQRGEMVLSPIFESIQLRHFQPFQRFYAFGLNRTLLFANISGGIKPLDKEIFLFFSHGDVFLIDAPIEAKIPGGCIGCHIDDGQGIYGVTSILSYSRARFSLPEQPILTATTPEDESETVIGWKTQQQSWQSLQTFWHSSPIK